jgi:hypothetical protein
MAIEVVPCIHPGSVDLRSSNYSPGDEVLHCSAAEWAEFIATVKTGTYDYLSRDLCLPVDVHDRASHPSATREGT